MQAIETTSLALEAIGHSRVLAAASSRMGLFLTEGGVRQKTADLQVLLRAVRKRPESVSPNVTLRPLVQDLLLPTVAFVVGPAELGYLLELRALRQLLGVPEPALLSRLSCTVLPADVWAQLQENGVDAPSWLQSPEEALRHRGRQLATAAIEDADALWKEFDARLAHLPPSSFAADTVRKAQRGLHPLRKRMIRDLEESQTAQLLQRSPQLSTATQLVRPRKRLQERVLGGLWLLSLVGASTAKELIQLAETHLHVLETGHDEHVMLLADESALPLLDPVERTAHE